MAAEKFQLNTIWQALVPLSVDGSLTANKYLWIVGLNKRHLLNKIITEKIELECSPTVEEVFQAGRSKINRSRNLKNESSHAKGIFFICP